MNVNSNGYTYGFATILVVLVAVILSSLAMGLKPFQQANITKEKKQNILQSIGLEVDRDQAEAQFPDFIKGQYVIKDGQVVSEDAEAAFNINMAKAIKVATADREVPLYIAEKDGSKYYIIPLRGKGLWGPIWGFLSLESDGKTVFGATFGHKGETPGLGAEITTPMFVDQFKGKTLDEADFTINVVKPGKGMNPNSDVDGISGGTITSVGVNDMIKDCLNSYKGLENI
ncbi:MAG: NADH:ubiquinone reductase (Na(+)-transporting) subunit C [Schleiferiaceae bacterium]|jgi:Na+-transporting NADH:ubiquinone oxidoreductase subunit C|nr:NADH:ubiquinone reductase (Na(+)-transporting) subunit C [Schleiferiaceae bacterium]